MSTLKTTTNRSAELHRVLTQLGPQAVPTRASAAPVPRPAPRVETYEEKVIATCQIAGRTERVEAFLALRTPYVEVLKALSAEPAPDMLIRLARERSKRRY